MQKLSTFLFFCFFFILAAAGIALLIEPITVLTQLHPSSIFSAETTILARQAAIGLLLAAGINLFCALRPETRLPLQLLVLAYLSGLLLAHGPAAFSSASVLWLVVVVYSLPLLLKLLNKLPKPSAIKNSGELEGEVKWFNPNKGFGFLVTADGEEFFVHFRALTNGGRRSLRQGQKVRFTTKESERGLQADQVTIQR